MSKSSDKTKSAKSSAVFKNSFNASGKPLPPTNQAKDGAKVRQWLAPGGPAALNMVECGFNRTVVVVDVDDA